MVLKEKIKGFCNKFRIIWGYKLQPLTTNGTDSEKNKTCFNVLNFDLFLLPHLAAEVVYQCSQSE